MRTHARGARRDLPLALVAAFTTWLTMFSWCGFSANWGRFLGPLLVIALIVSLGGVALRAVLVSPRAGIALHGLIVLVLVWLILGGSFIHPFASTYDIDVAIQNGWVSASTNVAPVPETVPSIAPLMIVCGAGALVLVDVLACWLHRVSLAGLPLLAVYGAPVIGFEGGVSWLVFVIAAVGFLLMMFLQESARISRWGRLIGATCVADSTGFGEGFGVSGSRAGTIGGVAVVLAVILPLFIPNLHLHGVDPFGTSGGGGAVTVVNPIVSMRRDLQRGKDVHLLDVRTNNPDPSYLRIAVLTHFNGVTWTTDGPPTDSGQVADGPMPILEEGLDDSAVKTHYQYTVRATSKFDSTWLPTQFPVSSIVANGTWNYDRATMNFFAGDTQTNTRGLTYSMTAAVPDLSPREMFNALPAPEGIRSAYTSLPPSVPWGFIHGLAVQATDGATNQYQKAVRLQDWFRTKGGFHYNLDAHPADGKNALVDFLTRGHGGRVGYCEQFASAYAVMARTLGIPARVAVGFLQPTHKRNNHWIYSAYDMHAWPELYFRGSGWVRFEPTPATRARVAPSWTHRSGKNQGRPQNIPRGGLGVTPSSSPTPTTITPPPPPTDTTSTTSSGFRFPWAVLGETLIVLGVAGALLLTPSVVRGARRVRRLGGGAEDAWGELRDTAIDLGVGWPVGRSPRETGAGVAEWFSAETEGPPPGRPRRGRGVAPRAEDALDRIVLVLEQVRYARSADDVPGALAGDVRTCTQALERGCTRATLIRARWLPRSIFARSAAVAHAAESEPLASRGGVRDHVG